MAYEPPRFPTVDEIRERAIEIYQKEYALTHPGESAPTPEINELKEGGYWNRAQHEMMTGIRSQLEEYLNFLEEEAKKIRGELGEQLELTPEHERELKETIYDFRSRYKVAKDELKESTEQIERLTGELEELKRRPLPVREVEKVLYKMLTVKFKADMPQFIGADTKRYGPYRAGDVAQLPEGNAAVLVERGMAELWRAVGPPVPPVYVPPPKPIVEPRKGLTADQVRLLRAKFNVALMDEVGRVPPNASSIFIVKIDEAKGKSYDETLKYILDSVKEIVGREVARKELARPRVAPRVIEPYRPREEKEEEPKYVMGRIPPAYPPNVPLNGPEERPFPRHPTKREEIELWKAFQYRLQELGMNVYDYQKLWNEYIFGSNFQSWNHLLKQYEKFVDAIVSGKPLTPLWQWKGVPIPYGLEELLSTDPFQKVADLIIWAASTTISNARDRGKDPTVEEVMQKLEEMGYTVTIEDLKDALMKGYKLKGTNMKYDLWFLNITLQDLEELLVAHVLKEGEEF